MRSRRLSWYKNPLLDAKEWAIPTEFVSTNCLVRNIFAIKRPREIDLADRLICPRLRLRQRRAERRHAEDAAAVGDDHAARFELGAAVEHLHVRRLGSFLQPLDHA